MNYCYDFIRFILHTKSFIPHIKVLYFQKKTTNNGAEISPPKIYSLNRKRISRPINIANRFILYIRDSQLILRVSSQNLLKNIYSSNFINK